MNRLGRSAIFFIGLFTATTFFVVTPANAKTWWWSISSAIAGILSINADTTTAQVIAVDTAGNDVAVATAAGTTTISVPTANGSKRGALSAADWTTFNGKMASTGSGLVEEINLLIETATDKTYTLVLNAAYARQVTSIAAKCASGTISGELKIEGTGITNCQAAQMPWTSTETSDTCDTGSSNNLAAGNTLTLVTTSNSSCLDLQVTVLTTRD